MTPEEQHQREVFQALLNEALAPWVGAKPDRLKSVIPGILHTTELAAASMGVSPPVIDLCARSFLATVAIRGVRLFPGL